MYSVNLGGSWVVTSQAINRISMGIRTLKDLLLVTLLSIASK